MGSRSNGKWKDPYGPRKRPLKKDDGRWVEFPAEAPLPPKPHPKRRRGRRRREK